MRFKLYSQPNKTLVAMRLTAITFGETHTFDILRRMPQFWRYVDMNEIGPDIISTLLKGFSWCVSSSNYDTELRTYTVRIVDDPNNTQNERELKWEGIIKMDVKAHDEEDLDDNCMDLLIGIHEKDVEDGVFIHIHSDKYSIDFISEHSVVISDSRT